MTGIEAFLTDQGVMGADVFLTVKIHALVGSAPKPPRGVNLQ